MKLYSTMDNLSPNDLQAIIKYYSNKCDRINIYFPTDCIDELLSFKNAFLNATDIHETEDELSTLEPKEGFTMIIASLSTEVCKLLLQVKASYHLSFGLIQSDTIVFYVGDEGEIVIEDNDPILTSDSLYSTFKSI